MNNNQEEKIKGLLGKEWYDALKQDGILDSHYWVNLGSRVAQERKLYTIYPEKDSGLLFKAFRTTSLSKVKVVILGQDPYHDGSYDGFAFSNKGKLSISPSLRNIFLEIEREMFNGLKLDQDPDLERWAKQGVLLINTAHTVRKGQAGSHLSYWIPFTLTILNIISTQERPIVWLLWGRKAEDIYELSNKNKNHLVLKSPHPSPFSAHTGFFGNNHFKETNLFLTKNKLNDINW